MSPTYPLCYLPPSSPRRRSSSAQSEIPLVAVLSPPPPLLTVVPRGRSCALECNHMYGAVRGNANSMCPAKRGRGGETRLARLGRTSCPRGSLLAMMRTLFARLTGSKSLVCSGGKSDRARLGHAAVADSKLLSSLPRSLSSLHLQLHRRTLLHPPCPTFPSSLPARPP